jgi:predicted metal-dependent hydrolase
MCPVSPSRDPGSIFSMVATQAPSVTVPVREVEFDRSLDDLPKHFARDNDILGSHVLMVLSSVFPDGEDFFVRSVEAARDQIDDPTLRKNVDGFIGQESWHGREHRVLNERLAELGYPTRAIGTYVVKTLRWRERIQSKKFNLAVTAALEHYTATLAETLLGDPEARAEIGHDGVRHLLMWHALEEAEHKAVAFDVYRAVGGSERMRKAAMWVVHLNFIFETGTWTVISLARDPDVRRHPLRVLRGLGRLTRSPFVRPRTVRQLFQYHRRDFHPNDRDTTALIAEWRTELFGADGRLSDLRAS